MVRSELQRRLFAGVVSALLAVVLGCASPPKPAVCAAIGGVLGGGGGVVAGAVTPDPDSREMGAYGGAGAVIGASAGYLICRAMQKEEVKPPPPAPPAPAPRAAPMPAPAPVEEKIVLRGVNFDFDKSVIRPDAAVILDEAASLLNSSPGRRVRVSGHTDSIGTEDYNQGLSERRAKSVKDYLVTKGVDASRLTSMGFGESNPIAPNDTKDGRALNRRVELNVD